MKKVVLLICMAFIVSAGCVAQSDGNVIIIDRPVVESFTGTPSTISAGQSCTLEWEVSGSNTVYIDQGVGNVAAKGTTSSMPHSPSIFPKPAPGPLDSM